MALIGIFLNEKIKEVKAQPKGNILYVGGKGPHNYTTIQHAIDDASDNYTIFVYAGIYQEHITVTTAITIIGESNRDTIIDGLYNETALTTMRNGVVIENLRFRYAGGKPDDALLNCTDNDLTVQNCIFEHARHGILLSKTSAAAIHNCTFYHTAIGVRAKQSSHALLTGCTFTKNGIGILSTASHSLNIKKIYGELNGVTIMAENCEDIHIAECRLSNGNENQVNLYAERTTNISVKNCTVYHSGRGMRFAECTLASINNSRIYDSKIGIEVSETQHICIENSWIYENDVGIYLRLSENVVIAHNAVYDNYVANLAAEESSGNARHNWWGSPLEGVTTVHAKGGRLPTFPRLTEKPPEPTDSSVITRRDIPEEPEQPITILQNNNDTDGDGTPDWWENKYGYDPMDWNNHTSLDPDHDGLNNIEEYLTNQWESHPFKKDLFIEIDIMDSSYGIAKKKIDSMRERFASHDIILHIDDGNMNGGQIIEKREYVNYATLIDVYWKYFLQEDPTNWRKGVFHYVLLSDSLFKTAPGFVFIGWDEADAFALSISYYKEEIPQIFRSHVLATVFMHELGHTLGLFHDVYPAIDNESSIIPFAIPLIKGQLIYRNYRSCMNYQYAWQVLDYSDGTRGRGDFDDWDHVDLTFFQNSHWGH